MKKKILSLCLVFLLLQSCFSLVPSAEKYENPIIYPHSDTYIRVNSNTSNFSTAESFVVDNSTANTRISFIKFDMSGYEKELDSADSVVLSFLTGGDAGGEGFAFYLYPLEGAYKDIDLTTVTYNYAGDISSDGISVIDYAPPSQQYEGKKYNWYSIDVTDYVTSQSDKTALFMLKSANGAFSIYSSEKKGCEPYITIKNGYTDIRNRASDIADEICQKYSGMPVTDDIDFVTSADGYSICYSSQNTAYMSDDGSVISRPGSDEYDARVKFTVNVAHPSYPDDVEKNEFEISLLKEGSCVSDMVEYTDGGVDISFNNPAVSPDNKLLLEIPVQYFNDGSEFEIYLGAKRLTSFTPDLHSDTCLVDVSSCVSEISGSSVFTLCPRDGLSSSEIPLKLLSVPSSEAEVALALNDILANKLSYVSSNLSLPSNIQGTDISWSSGNKNVISDDGRVERPDSDTSVEITASFSTQNYSYTKKFTAFVIRENTDASNNEFAPLKDPMHISDEEFFGVWNNSNNTWTCGPVLMYDEIPALSSVEEKAKLGDYENAKSLLLAYYRTKGGDNIYTYTEDDSYLVETDALYEKIGGWLQMDTFLASKEIGTEWQWVTFDLTDAAYLGSAYWLLDADMDGSTLEIASKENSNGCHAYLEVVANGRKTVFPAIGDTYISAGDNINSTYGHEEILLCREEAADSLTPFGTDSARPYFRFGVNTAFNNITSIKLSVYARSVGSSSKKIYAMKTYDLKLFDEDSLTWASHYPQVFNFKQTGNIWGAPQGFHQSKWNTSFEYINYWARLYQGQYLLRRYMTTGGEEYAYRAFEYVLSLYEQQPKANYPRSLDGGWRIESLIRTYYTGINSVYMTPEVSCAFLKYIYTHGLEFQETTLAGAANQDSAVQVNLARICAFFPEVTQSAWWENVLQKLVNLYSNTMLNSDGSYTESTNAYITGVLTEMEAAIEIVKSAEGEDSYYYNFFTDTYKRLVSYYMNFSYANGNQIPYGDGGKGNARDIIGEKSEFIYDGEWEYFSSMGERGTPMSYTSNIYPAKAMAMLRSGWYNDDLCAFMSNDNGGSHGHCDDLALDVTAFDRYLLVDAGGAAYSEGSEFSQRRFDTGYHNTIEIDGKNQAIYAAAFPGKMTLKTNDSFDLLHGGNTSIYPGFDVNRKVFMIKNRYLIVSDYIFAPEGEHSYRQTWHPDENSGITLNSQSGVAFTNYSSGGNIKIATVDPENIEAKLFDRLKSDNRSIKCLEYSKENVTGDVVYDTVLYPTKYGEDVSFSLTRLSLGDTPRTTATAFEIVFDTSKASYYLSNEETPVQRSFGTFGYNGEMAYTEYDENQNLSYIALTGGSHLTNNGVDVFKSSAYVQDLAISYESSNIYIYSSSAIPFGGITFRADRSFEKVYFNDSEVSFNLNSGYITTNGTEITSGDYDGIKPGTPSSQGKPNGTQGSGGGSVSPIVPVTPVTPSEPMLKDIEGHWAQDAITELFQKSVVSGDENGYYNPDNSVTRAEFIKLLAAALKLDTAQSFSIEFFDVASGDWFAPYIQAAFSAGLADGYPDNSFKPYGFITREEMAKLLCAASEYVGISSEPADDINFNDAYDISPWAEEYVKKSVTLSLVTGDDAGNFNPLKNLTRAEAATVIFRLINR